MDRRGFGAILTVCILIVLSGCAARRTPLDDLYSHLREEPYPPERNVLQGQRVVIDPGHGGYFDGVVGADSLREADANLGVALYLWGLLEEAGADVHMTRTADTDFLPPGSTELRDDLEARLKNANDFDPEAFVSIHHNSNLPLDRGVNKIEVYYKGDDPGPSLELAGDVHMHLARNLGIKNTEIKQGNYYILRNSTAGAAVLGEASYLSHPVVEEKLKLSKKQKLEAESYFLGLVSYFARGIPDISRLAPCTDTVAAPCEISFSIRPGGGVPIDPASVRISIGRQEFMSSLDAATGTMHIMLDPDAPNGAYAVRALARSTRGATARSDPFVLVVDRPVEYILPLRLTAKPDSVVSLEIKLLDSLGQPVIDGTEVVVRSLRSGITLSGRSRRGIFGFETDSSLLPGDFAVETTGKKDTISFPADASVPSLALRVLDAESKGTIPFPTVERSGKTVSRGDSEGRLLLARPCPGESLVVRADGYRPTLFEYTASHGTHEILIHPIFGGVLKYARIAIDPGGGGADHGGRGANMLRGASVNLEVAKRLRDLLRRGGAEVLLTREGEENMSMAGRVERVNRFGADIAVGIHHGPAPVPCSPGPSAMHYPRSEKGKALAETIASTPGRSPTIESLDVVESAGIFLSQTSCPACELHLGSVEEKPVEALLSNPHHRTVEAERIFVGIARYLANDDSTCLPLGIILLSGGVPVPHATVCLDRILVRRTDEAGEAQFVCVEQGPHMFTVEIPGRRTLNLMRDLPAGGSADLLLEIP